MKNRWRVLMLLSLCLLVHGCAVNKKEGSVQDELTYDMGQKKPKDSQLRIGAGDIAPEFSLPSTKGDIVSLSQFKGKRNVVLSFVPAAWTPICSKQWPGYNMLEDMFQEGHAVLLGISVDNVPSLHAWTKKMGGVWFEVLSDFWPHGDVAKKYGVFRPDGMSERALFFINKEGVVKSVLVMDINKVPSNKVCATELEKLSQD